MERQLIAYLLLIGMAAAAISFIVFKRYNTHERTYDRRKQRERAAHDSRMAEKDRNFPES